MSITNKKISELWRIASAKEKKPYNDKAKEDETRYYSKLKEYNQASKYL
jgi:hypothetical protein